MLGAVSAIAVLAFVAESKTNDAAYGHWNYLGYIAKAYAVQERCPRLRVNRDVLMAVAEKYKIGFGAGSPDFSAMTQMMVKYTSFLQSQPVNAACVLGTNSFGPEGVLVRNLMIGK